MRGQFVEIDLICCNSIIFCHFRPSKVLVDACGDPSSCIILNMDLDSNLDDIIMSKAASGNGIIVKLKIQMRMNTFSSAS